MEKVSWNNGCYLFGGKPGFLVSGEFHYFRVPRQDWKKRLRLFREAGGNCVATYVPWILHEPTEGNYRFGGAPWLELEAFLSLCCEEGLYVLCRPGPYQYSEMRYDGLPSWLCENYPELLARDIRGNIFRKSSVSYLHPLFLQKTREWFSQVCPILAKYTVSRGGSIAFAQFDNELMGIQEWFGTLDYHPVTMGFGSETGRYARFLKKRYGTAEAMAEAYGQSWSSFAQAVPFDGEARTDNERRRMTDYQDFYYACTAEYASLLTKWMREYGIDCPFVHNSGGPDMNAEFIETADALGGDFLLGSDHYYNLDMDWNQNNPTPQYAVKVMSSCGQLRALGYPPTVMEMPGGSCSEWPPITPTDLKSCYMTNLAVGMKGLNYYIFTGGVNPDGIGNNGDSYDYGASVGAKGEIRPSYAVQKEFGLMLRGNPWLAQAEQCGDFALGFSWADARGKSLPQPRREEGPGGWETWKFLLRGPAISSLCASFSPELVDRGADDLSARCAGKPLVVASSACMAQKEQRRLADFVAGGGKLLLLPVIPGLDERFRPCTVLRELIGGAMRSAACRSHRASTSARLKTSWQTKRSG